MFPFTQAEVHVSHKHGLHLRLFKQALSVGVAAFIHPVDTLLPCHVYGFHGCYQVLYFHTIGTDILYCARPHLTRYQ